MKLMKVVKILSLTCIIILLPACGKSGSKASLSTEVQVAASNPATTNIQSLDVYGDVKVNKSEEIIIDFPAKVKDIYIEDGALVQKGDKLLTLDFEDYKLQIKTKENEILMDEIQLKGLEANSNPQMLEANRIKEELNIKQGYVSTGEDPDIKPLQNSLALIEQSILMAKNQYVANKQLFETDLLSQEELSQSEQNFKNKEKEKADTLTAIEKIKTNRNLEISTLSAQLKGTQVQSNNTDQQKISSIEVLKVKIDTSKLVLTSMRNKLNKPYIKGNDLIAPADNLILYDINCMKGTEISSAYGSLLKAMYQDTLYVTADIPEESLTSVNVGDLATITLADNAAKEITGKVSSVSTRAIEKDGDTIIEAIIAIEKGKELLKPGLTADIKLFTN